ncbi:unnamed protein product [Acanthoscelides obtectus]|uniref:Uncharacterized protein n=1 Tax=Acanthoscelides obtectus TaxID=200917 RepID=A0A9P0LU45_ACAOB|nr:unnamed protein product [Acanthoscelides obtectus]CAK1650159.1 hypothetical protein AOBTE_LOCUS16649 [Acanthoscelides obtectus]
MALCVSNYCSICVDIGAYGKVSDSGVFKESTLYKKLTERSLDIPDATPIIIENKEEKLPYVIVAHEAFGMETLEKPYHMEKSVQL